MAWGVFASWRTAIMVWWSIVEALVAHDTSGGREIASAISGEQEE
jgi:hypothetical protein